MSFSASSVLFLGELKKERAFACVHATGLSDKEIESIQNLIKNVSEAGIPSVKYNLNIIGIPRSEKEKGRGGSSNSTLRFNKIEKYFSK